MKNKHVFWILIITWIIVVLVTTSCTVLEPTLEPVGTVVNVQDGRVLVVFTQVSGQDVGSAWFKLDSAYLGQQIRLK